MHPPPASSKPASASTKDPASRSVGAVVVVVGVEGEEAKGGAEAEAALGVAALVLVSAPVPALLLVGVPVPGVRSVGAPDEQPTSVGMAAVAVTARRMLATARMLWVFIAS